MSDSNARAHTQQDIDDSRRDGLSLDTALVIRAEDSWIGVGMEYEAIRARHGRMHEEWTPTSQQLVSEAGRYYDQLNIVLSDGQELTYFFDITDFYGRKVVMSDELRAILDEDDAELDDRSLGDEKATMDLEPLEMTSQVDSDGLDDDPCLETAVVIGAETVWSSVCEEYDYLSRRHGLHWDEWTVRVRDCLSRNGRYYDLIEFVPKEGEPLTYCFDVTSGYEDGLHEVSVKQGLMETRRHPGMYFQVRLDGAATARVVRDPEGDVLWAEVVALAHQQFERQRARSVLAEALVMAREWNDRD